MTVSRGFKTAVGSQPLKETEPKIKSPLKQCPLAREVRLNIFICHGRVDFTNSLLVDWRTDSLTAEPASARERERERERERARERERERE